MPHKGKGRSYASTPGPTRKKPSPTTRSSIERPNFKQSPADRAAQALDDSLTAKGFRSTPVAPMPSGPGRIPGTPLLKKRWRKRQDTA